MDVLGAQVSPTFLADSIAGQTGKHVTGKVVELVAQTPDGPALVQLQVIDAQHNMYVVTLKLSTAINKQPDS